KAVAGAVGAGAVDAEHRRIRRLDGPSGEALLVVARVDKQRYRRALDVGRVERAVEARERGSEVPRQIDVVGQRDLGTTPGGDSEQRKLDLVHRSSPASHAKAASRHLCSARASPKLGGGTWICRRLPGSRLRFIARPRQRRQDLDSAAVRERVLEALWA